MLHDPVDVIVVGAGFSGLAAARHLKDAGVELVVLEARDRVGGRTLTEVRGGIPIEAGGQFIGARQDRVLAWAERYGAGVFDAYGDGEWLYGAGGSFSRQGELWPRLPDADGVELERAIERIDGMASAVPLEAPWAAPEAERWDRETLQGWVEREVPSEAVRAFLRLGTEITLAADWSDVSLLHELLIVRTTGGLESAIWTAQDLRVEGGTQSLAIAAACELGDAVRLDSPVRAIEVIDGSARVHMEGGRVLDAERVVVALPPALAARLVYRPPLPERRDQLMQRMPMGSVAKAIAVYERPFWREQGLSGLVLSTDGAVSWIYDNCWSDAEVGMLVGFVTGHAATWLRAMDPAASRVEVLGCFEAAFGEQALDVREYVEVDWAEKEYSRGCYAGYGPPGFWTSVGSELREPVGPIHWAGTETAPNWMSFIDGAIRSGERAADEVIADILSTR